MRARSFVLAAATIILAQIIVFDPAISHALIGIGHAAANVFGGIGQVIADTLSWHPLKNTFSIATVVMAPLAVPTRVAWGMLGCSNAHGWKLIKEDELDSYLDGRVRKVVVASIHAYIERKLAAEKRRKDHPVRTAQATAVSVARRAERKAEGSRGRPRTKPTTTAASPPIQPAE